MKKKCKLSLAGIFQEPAYEMHTLEQTVSGNMVVRYENPDETRYSLMQDGRELAFIRGYFDNDKVFHIQRIKNNSGYRGLGFEYLSQVYHAVEQDLRSKGVQKITTRSLAKLAHIAVKRYGFQAVNGKSYEELRDSCLRKIPWKCVSLEKKL